MVTRLWEIAWAFTGLIPRRNNDSLTATGLSQAIGVSVTLRPVRRPEFPVLRRHRAAELGPASHS